MVKKRVPKQQHHLVATGRVIKAPKKISLLLSPLLLYLLAECLTNVPLTVSGNSSVYRNDLNNWGPHLALTPVSNTWTGYWHSADHDYNPWIALKMSKTYEVAVVEVDDRKQAENLARFTKVEVLVGPSPNMGAYGTKSCGTKSYGGGASKTYR